MTFITVALRPQAEESPVPTALEILRWFLAQNDIFILGVVSQRLFGSSLDIIASNPGLSLNWTLLA